METACETHDEEKAEGRGGGAEEKFHRDCWADAKSHGIEDRNVGD